MTALAEQVDPIKLNQTLTATARGVDRTWRTVRGVAENGNTILDDLNARMPQIRDDTRLVADLADVYADASPDLWDGLQNAVTTARTFNDHRADIDAALMGALGFADAAADTFDQGGPYFVRGAADLVPTTSCSTTTAPDLLHDPQLQRVQDGSPGRSAETVTRWRPRRARSRARATRTSIPTTCRG